MLKKFDVLFFQNKGSVMADIVSSMRTKIETCAHVAADPRLLLINRFVFLFSNFRFFLSSNASLKLSAQLCYENYAFEEALKLLKNTDVPLEDKRDKYKYKKLSLYLTFFFI